MLLLVDLSNNNPGPIDFGALKRHGVYGAWMKVSEGTTFIDQDYAARARAARIVGLHVGGYHFARPAPGTAEHEAAFFAGLLGKVERRDLRPVLDLERNDEKMNPDQLHSWCVAFLTKLHNLSKVRGLTYSSPSFIAAQRWPHTFGVGKGLWLAEYGPDDGQDHGAHVPAPWRRCVAHQFTSRGTVPGVNGHVDLSHAKARRRILAHPVRGLP